MSKQMEGKIGLKWKIKKQYKEQNSIEKFGQ